MKTDLLLFCLIIITKGLVKMSRFYLLITASKLFKSNIGKTQNMSIMVTVWT